MQPTEHKMPIDYDNDLSQRVTRVEAAVDSLTGTLNEVSQSIKHMERSMSAVGKTDMKTLATIAGSIVTVALTIWAILIAPINQQIGDMKEDLAKIDRNMALFATVPGDLLRLERSDTQQTEKIEGIERREAAGLEREKFLTDIVKELGQRTIKQTK